MDVEDHSNLSPQELARLVGEIGAFGTLREFLDWGGSQSPPLLPIHAVNMDEFAIDIIFPWQNRFLVLDTS